MTNALAAVAGVVVGVGASATGDPGDEAEFVGMCLDEGGHVLRHLARRCGGVLVS